LRTVVEPLVQKMMPAGIKLRFGDVHLGKEALHISSLSSPVAVEDNAYGDGDSLTNMCIVGNIDHRGDAVVDVECTGGRVVATAVAIRGTVIIELAKLDPTPPWFCGLRIYFPNPPDIDLTIKSSVFGVNFNDTFIKRKIVHALGLLVQRSAVLPNAISIGLSERMSGFQLKHPRPQGVMRVQVISAQGLRVKEELDPDESPGQRIRYPWTRQSLADPFVELTIGSTTERTKSQKGTLRPQWDEDAVHDFVVTQSERQYLRAVVRDDDRGLFRRRPTDVLGRAEVAILDLILDQQADAPTSLWINLKSESQRDGFGRLHLRVHWRPLAQPERLSADLVLQDRRWLHGHVRSSSAMFIIHLWHACSLPASEDLTAHWVTVSISGDDRDSEPKDSFAAKARTPSEHGLEMLRRRQLPSEALEPFLKDSQQAARVWRQRYEGPAFDYPVHLMDAVFECPFYFLIGAVERTQLTLTMRRPLKGLVRSDTNSVVVGTLVYNLRELLSGPQLSAQGLWPITGQFAGISQVKLRMQLWPLLSPPGGDVPPSTWANPLFASEKPPSSTETPRSQSSWNPPTASVSSKFRTAPMHVASESQPSTVSEGSDSEASDPGTNSSGDDEYFWRPPADQRLSDSDDAGKVRCLKACVGKRSRLATARVADAGRRNWRRMMVRTSRPSAT